MKNHVYRGHLLILSAGQMLGTNCRDDDLSGSPFTLSEMRQHMVVAGIFPGNYACVPLEGTELSRRGFIYHTQTPRKPVK